MHTPVSTRRSGCEGHQPGPGSPFPHPRGPHAQHLPRSASVGKGKNRLSPENEVRWRVSRPESSPPGRPAAWAPKAGSPPGSLHRPLGRAGPHPIRGLQRGRGEAFPMYVGATWPFPGGRDGRTQGGDSRTAGVYCREQREAGALPAPREERARAPSLGRHAGTGRWRVCGPRHHKSQFPSPPAPVPTTGLFTGWPADPRFPAPGGRGGQGRERTPESGDPGR